MQIIINQSYDWLVAVSFHVSVMISFIICIRLIFNQRLKPGWSYLLWLILILSLILPSPAPIPLPIHLESSKHSYLIASTEDDFRLSTRTNESMDQAPVIIDSVPNNNTFVSTTLYKNGLFILWMSGLIMMSLWHITRVIHTIKHVNQCRSVNDNRILQLFSKVKRRIAFNRCVELKFSNQINSPASFGIFKPKILLPSHADQIDCEKLELVFEHELIHHKRFDLVFDALMVILKCLQWFNPLIWIAHSQMRMDCELSCDHCVIQNKSVRNKKDYAELLIQFAAKNTRLTPIYSMTSMSIRFNQLSQRVSSVTKDVRTSIYTSAQILFLAISVAILGQISPAYSSFTVKNIAFDYSNSQGISNFAQTRNNHSVKLHKPDKKIISGLLTSPVTSQIYPAVVLVHGCEGFDRRHAEWARQLTDSGFVTLRIQRQGLKTPYCEKPIAHINTLTAAQIMDAYAALDYLQTLDFVDKQRISIMSWESWSAIGAAATHGVGQVYLSRFHSAIAMYPDCTATYNGEFNAPLLIMVGDSDQWAQAKDCMSIKRIANQNSDKSMVSVKIYPDTYHGFDNQQIKQATFLPYAKNLGNLSVKGATAKYNHLAHLDARKQIQAFLNNHPIINE